MQVIMIRYKHSFLESKLYVKLELPDAFLDVVEGPMCVFLLEEQGGLNCIDNCFDGAHVQNSVMKECIQLGHMMEQEQSVLMNGIS